MLARRELEYLFGMSISGATVNDQGPDGSTAFIIACMNGRLDIAEVLMKAGADVTLIDEVSWPVSLKLRVFNVNLVCDNAGQENRV